VMSQKREIRGGEIDPSCPAQAQWGATGAEHAGEIPSTPENAPFPDQASGFYFDLPHANSMPPRALCVSH
jgi:hypothetical protein